MNALSESVSWTPQVKNVVCNLVEIISKIIFRHCEPSGSNPQLGLRLPNFGGDCFAPLRLRTARRQGTSPLNANGLAMTSQRVSSRQLLHNFQIWLTGLFVQLSLTSHYIEQGPNMITLFKKHSTIISVFLLLTLLVLIWFFPSSGLILGMVFLSFSLVIAGSAVVEKHRKAYLHNKITHNIFIRNVVLETIGIVLAMTLAGLLGRYIAEIVTKQISNDLTKYVTGIATGLLVGIGIGIFIKQTWGRFVGKRGL